MRLFNALLCGFVTGATFFLVTTMPKEAGEDNDDLQVSFTLGFIAGVASIMSLLTCSGGVR
jgi:hypothetical protein